MSSFLYTEELRTKLIHYAIRKAETEEYVSLGTLLDFAKRITGVRLTSKASRNLKRWIDRTLRKSQYFYTLKMEGMVWYTTAPAGRQAYLDWIRGRLAPKQNSNSSNFAGLQTYRNEAKKIIDDKTYLIEDDYLELEELFTQYMEYADAKAIVLTKRDDPSSFIVLGYKTRFTDERRRRRLLARYDHAWRYATTHYKDGVFLTLTTDPKNFCSIYESTMSISWAWNSFMSWLQKKLGFRPPYLKVLEFTKKGFPHLHVILFNVSYLAQHKEITEEWNRIGQGRINYEYAIYNKNGAWRWKKKRPQGGGRSVQRYLKKYLLKTMTKNALGTLALYWATNRRFYTTSRVLGKKTKKRTEAPEWQFFLSTYGVFLSDVLPYWADIVYSEFWGDRG